jgi:hypothetical protein
MEDDGMKTTLRSFIFVLLAVAGGMSMMAGNAQAEVETLPPGVKAHTKLAPKFVQVVIDFHGIPTFLDGNGHVWSTHKLMNANGDDLYQLPNLDHIKKIRPFIALDDKGHVFTWMVDTLQDDFGPSGLENSGYTDPKVVNTLENVTNIDSSGYEYFTAVANNKDVFVWANDKPISLIYSKAGIKAVSTHGMSEIHSIDGSATIPETRRLILLFDNGDVISLGIKQSGTQAGITDLKETLLAQYPGATDVVRNGVHSVVLPFDGTPRFWGGCFTYWKDISERFLTPNAVNGASSNITNVISIGINDWDDNTNPDVFIKKDGSIWASFAPIPAGKAGLDCYKSLDKKLFWEIKVINAKIVQAVAHENQIFMLDLDGNVWVSDGWFNQMIYKVKLNVN